MTVTIGAIREAAERIAGAIYPTPLIRLPLADEAEEVFVKAENLQRTGSFKLRGAYNFLASLTPAERDRGVVAHSSGNHAQGVACAARLLGIEATIVIPEGAPHLKVERTRAHGAAIVRCGNSSDERERVARELVESEGYILVPPFDHPLIVAGQGTVGLEIVQSLKGVRNVLVPVGGGGLSAGVATAIAALAPDARVIGVEPELAADAKESLEVGRPVSWSAEEVTRTMADGVRTQRIGDLNFEILRRLLAGVVTVSEEEIEETARWYLLEARLVVEPTGALSLAAYRRLRRGASELSLLPGPTVVVASGGNVGQKAVASLLD
ncbi:MAG TPA: threonine/serine dehydratase [Trueperaceae bacterium]